MNNEVKLPKDMMIVSETDEKGIIVYANDDFCKIAGFSREELIGKAHNMVRHNDMPKAAFEDLWKTIKSGNIWHGIVKNNTKDGNYYWVNATAYPSKTVDGKVRYISVRVKPTEEEILNALTLYSKLN
jgi:aerotaxis receptor